MQDTLKYLFTYLFYVKFHKNCSKIKKNLNSKKIRIVKFFTIRKKNYILLFGYVFWV